MPRMLAKCLALTIFLASASGQLATTTAPSDATTDPAAAAAAANDLVLEVQVSTEGDKAVFRLADGSTKEEAANAVIDFCSAHVGDTDLEQCTTALSNAVEASWAKKAAAAARREAWKDPASVWNFVAPAGSEALTAAGGTAGVTQLEVAVDAQGGSAVFAHAAGRDPFAEASEFCAQHVSAVAPETCQAQLITALEKRLTDLKAFTDQADATKALGDRPTIAQQLGTLLPPGGGEAVPAESLLTDNVKVVALYFAADWCGPCRQFTPALKKYHHMVKDFKKKGFDVVWVSGSKNQAGFDSYFKEMPWPALPLASQQQNNALRAKYKVQGFPTLVFVDAATGTVLVADGRAAVAKDPHGDGFPYATPLQVAGKFAKALWVTLVPPSIRQAMANHPAVVQVKKLIPAR